MERAFEMAGAGWREGARPARELPLAAGIIGILLVILVPLPPGAIDLLLVTNITVSLVILMTSACIARPTEFSVFPSLLLIITFFRLALNVATTRLILSNGATGLSAAGGVVQSFAMFVAGHDVVVGLVIFAILVVVQFVVITRGATRISEVAARFTLDGLPGKQNSIDSELSSGAITEAEARRRRAALAQEADFYGSMDGASKFVRGEAIASLLITVTNIAGGFTLGVLRHGMSLERSASTFTRLTVGDGLSNQVPALMVSVGAALLITRNSSGEGFATDLRRQLVRDGRLYHVAALFLLALILTGLPPLPLLVGAAACFAVGRVYGRGAPAEEASRVAEEDEPEAEVPEAPAAERVRSLLVVEAIELQVGYRLVRLVDSSRGGDLVERLARVRERLALDLGLVVPAAKICDNPALHPGEYGLLLRGSLIGRWRLHPGRVLLVSDGEPADLPGAIPGVEPVSGKAGVWVTEEVAAAVGSPGGARRAVEVLVDHLERLLRLHAADLLARQEVSRLVSDLRQRAPSLVDELIPGVLRIGDLHKVLQGLLREHVSIRNLEQILEAMADGGDPARDPAELTRRVRVAVGRSICSRVTSRGGALRAAMLDPALEEFLQNSADKADGPNRLGVEPEMADALAKSIVAALQELEAQGYPPVLACSGAIRLHLRSLIARSMPFATVLAYDEIPDEFHLEAQGTVSLGTVH